MDLRLPPDPAKAALSDAWDHPAVLHVLRVFCAADGTGGNPLGVVLDGGTVPAGERQAVARRLGFSETVFVDDRQSGQLRIFTPTVELPFAGHPLVGTAWLLGRDCLRPPAGEVAIRRNDELTYIAGRPEWAPEFDFQQLAGPEDVEALEGPPTGHDVVDAWAWIDEHAGLVRSRVFPVGLGIAEDEATGAAAVRLCALLGRGLDIRQGRGSQILAQPLAGGLVEIGGRVQLDEVREL